MNLWLAAAAVVSAALVPCGAMSLTGTPERRLVGLEMTGMVIAISMVLFTVGFGRSPFIDLPLAVAVMIFGGSLVFSRFLEKHL